MIKPFNIILVTTAFLFLILGLYNYLLFYLLVKIFCIMVGFSIYSIGWNAKQFIKENLLIFLSLGYLIISVFTILHVVSLSEINVFPQLETNNKSIQFWIMARTVEGISFLLTGFFINKDIDKDIKNFFLKNNLLSSIYIILTVILSILIFLPGILPVCSYNINEYTNFKINCEYFISFIFALTAILFWKNKNKLNREVFQLLFISILISIPANILFTFNYSGIYFYDMSGHILKYISFFLVYKALVVNSLKKPYHNLFQQYNHSQKRLVATGSMISTLFHDLKNPLSTIRAMSQIGCMKTKTKEAENYFARIESKVDNISHMITRMLNTFRPEEPKKINIKEPFQEILEDIKPVCETKNIQIIFQNENPEHVLNAILEVNLFKRAITNLLHNAINALGKKGKIKINVKKNSSDILIKISDNGPGIPPEIQDNLFKPFVQKGKGTGLGLYMVYYTITTIHHGKIWYKTKENEGTTFYIQIPTSYSSLKEAVT